MIGNKSNTFNKVRGRLLRTYKSIPGSSVANGKRKLTSLPGVYFIYRVSDNKVYIGESANIQRRMLQHFTVHRPSQTIDWAIKNEGPSNFRCGVVEVVRDRKMRLNLETKYVNLFNSYYNGYNSTIDGERKNKFVHWISKKRIKLIKKYLPGRMEQLKHRRMLNMRLLTWWRKSFR